MTNDLTETQRHNLLSKAINVVNNFYYEQMDKNKITGETTILIDAWSLPHITFWSSTNNKQGISCRPCKERLVSWKNWWRWLVKEH